MVSFYTSTVSEYEKYTNIFESELCFDILLFLNYFKQTDSITLTFFSIYYKFMPADYNKITTSLVFMWKIIDLFHTNNNFIP